MKNDSKAETKVVLGRPVQPRRVVIGLNGAKGEPVVQLDINAAAERRRETGVAAIEIRAINFLRIA